MKLLRNYADRILSLRSTDNVGRRLYTELQGVYVVPRGLYTELQGVYVLPRGLYTELQGGLCSS